MAASRAPSQVRLVRLKPYDPKVGHVLRSYFYAPADERGRPGPGAQRFLEQRGWYRVSLEVAKYLATIRQIETNPRSPLAFDVCTFEEAQRIDEAERGEGDARATAERANDLTTADLGENRVRARDIAAAEQRGATQAPAPPVPPARRRTVPQAQEAIRRGVRDPQTRSMRPVEEPS
jgi:hypothetical protein